ncbi:MAG: hypothetical protein ABEJ35_01380 [Halobacteriaceae archaeon]
MAGLHPRSIVQTLVLVALIALTRYTTLLDTGPGQLLAGAVVLIVAADIVWVTWRRFSGRRESP